MWLTLMTGFGAILGSLVIAWAYSRANTPKIWQETAEGYRQRAEQLLAENADLRKRIDALEAKVQVLIMRPDMTEVLARNEVIAAELKGSIAQIAGDLAATVTTTADELRTRVAAVAEQLAAHNQDDRVADHALLQEQWEKTMAAIKEIGKQIARSK